MAKKYNLDLYKHNDFIKMVQVKKQMSFQQQRIFDTMLSTVQEMKKTGDFIDLISEGELKMDLDIFKEQLLKGAKIKKINRKELEVALETMVDIKFKYTIKEDNVDKIGTFVIFQKAEINFNTREIFVVFGKEFRTENLLPTSNYTALSLEFLNTFSSQYARLLYQYFKMLIGKDNNKPFRTDIVLEIEFIKSLFGINESTHKMYSQNTSVMLKNTIEPAVNQINKYSDIKVSYKKIKKGRKIHYLAFDFYPKKEFVKVQKEEILKEKTPPLFIPKFKKFKEFRNWIVENYMDQDIVIGPKGFSYNTIIKITPLGYLSNKENGKDLSPDNAQELWGWLFQNTNRIGKIYLSHSDILTLDYQNKFLFVHDQKTNKVKSVKIIKVFVQEDNINCNVAILTEEGEEKIIQNYYTVDKLKQEVKYAPLTEEEVIEGTIIEN